jgi:hypothetical protein
MKSDLFIYKVLCSAKREKVKKAYMNRNNAVAADRHRIQLCSHPHLHPKRHIFEKYAFMIMTMHPELRQAFYTGLPIQEGKIWNGLVASLVSH